MREFLLELVKRVGALLLVAGWLKRRSHPLFSLALPRASFLLMPDVTLTGRLIVISTGGRSPERRNLRVAAFRIDSDDLCTKKESGSKGGATLYIL